MKQQFWKWGLIVLLGGLSIVFTQCGKPFADKGDLIYSVDGVLIPIKGASAASSMAAFEETVYPLTRQYCASCHASGQQPLHASSSMETAHNALLSQYKVNFTDPDRSRMVMKLRDESHNCWGSCSAAADQMSDAIAEWGEMMAAAGEEVEVPGETGDFDLVTATSGTIAQLRQAETDGTIRYTAQAPAAMLTAPMVRATSDVTYVHVPNDGNNQTLANNDGSAGIASFTFSAAQALNGGALWGLVYSNPTDDDSFHVRVNNSNIAEWRIPTTNNEFRWMRVTNGANNTPVNYNITQGTNTITLRERKDGTRLATLLWVNSQAYVPIGLGTAGAVTISLSLNEALGAAPPGAVPTPVQAFQQTVYPLLRQSCVSCHGTGQRPEHAHPTVQTAYTQTTDAGLINRAAPANSRLVTKNHNCGSAQQCNTFAQNMTAAIQQMNATLSAPQAGYRIEFRLEDYDAFSYQLTNLRIYTGDRPVYVKNIRLMVNGQYNPQHSNYTYIDQMVPANMSTGVALTPGNMIVLKDRGEANDRISLAFEVLEFR